MSQQPSQKVTFSRYECAQLLGISVRLLDKCIASGEIKAARIGDCVLIPRAEIKKFTTDTCLPTARGSPPNRVCQ
ncbi:MAG: helix-turn-helix domain-containing protein [Candidatus Acidiferrales bacterium]